MFDVIISRTERATRGAFEKRQSVEEQCKPPSPHRSAACASVDGLWKSTSRMFLLLSGEWGEGRQKRLTPLLEKNDSLHCIMMSWKLSSEPTLVDNWSGYVYSERFAGCVYSGITHTGWLVRGLWSPPPRWTPPFCWSDDLYADNRR